MLRTPHVIHVTRAVTNPNSSRQNHPCHEVLGGAIDVAVRVQSRLKVQEERNGFVQVDGWHVGSTEVLIQNLINQEKKSVSCSRKTNLNCEFPALSQ